MTERLNYRRLRTLLKEAARRAFDEVRASHPDESFYVFALHASSDATYAVPSANSKEGLKRRRAEYAQRSHAPDESDEQFLRWNACDWAYHAAGEVHFTEAQQFIDKAINKVGQETTVATWDRRVQRIFEIFIKSLQDLDAEGFFGTGRERNEIVLLLTIGDCDADTILAWAEQLNPPEAFQRFKESFSTQAGVYRQIGSRKHYSMRSVSVSADQRLLAVGGWDHVLVFSLPEYEEILKKKVSRDPCVGVRSCAISPDGKQVFVGLNAGSRKGAIQRWSVEKKKRLTPEFPPLPGIVSSLAVSPDGRLLAAGCEEDPKIRVWETGSLELVAELTGHKANVHCVRFSPTGKLLTSIEHTSKSLRLWDIASGKVAAKLNDRGEAVAFSPDGLHLAVVSGMADDRVEVRLWNLDQQRLIRTFAGPAGSLKSISLGFSASGTMLASGGGFGGEAVLWELASGSELARLDAGHNEIYDLVFLDRDRTVALVGSLERLPVTLWDVSAAKRKCGQCR